ncbi:MAG: hypothetical protein GY754_29830 [bacterium]|nr:hypothetical protein [bacterium]
MLIFTNRKTCIKKLSVLSMILVSAVLVCTQAAYAHKFKFLSKIVVKNDLNPASKRTIAAEFSEGSPFLENGNLYYIGMGASDPEEGTLTVVDKKNWGRYYFYDINARKKINFKIDMDDFCKQWARDKPGRGCFHDTHWDKRTQRATMVKSDLILGDIIYLNRKNNIGVISLKDNVAYNEIIADDETGKSKTMNYLVFWKLDTGKVYKYYTPRGKWIIKDVNIEVIDADNFLHLDEDNFVYSVQNTNTIWQHNPKTMQYSELLKFNCDNRKHRCFLIYGNRTLNTFILTTYTEKGEHKKPGPAFVYQLKEKKRFSVESLYTPYGNYIDDAGRYYYVYSNGTALLKKIDLTGKKRPRIVKTKGMCHELAFSGKYLYVFGSSLGHIDIRDPRTLGRVKYYNTMNIVKNMRKYHTSEFFYFSKNKKYLMIVNSLKNGKTYYLFQLFE